MRVLLLSAYDTASHRRLHEGLRRILTDVEFECCALPPRHYAWRAGGSALAFADSAPRRQFDVLLAMGPVDLAALLGLRPDLARARVLLYLHEHEFAYPEGAGEQGRVDRCMRQLLAALAADVVVANSRWCAERLVAGASTLLARLPDAVPRDTVERLAGRLRVEPVPLEDALFERGRQRRRDWAQDGVVHIVWNHRHEWDKGPDRLAAILARLRAASLDFRFHLLGQRFRRRPPGIDAALAFLEAHPRHRGQVDAVPDREAYLEALLNGDLVLSTALQEFQGLAMMEACVLGARPCVPDRLVYPEWVPAAFRARSAPDDAAADAEALAARIIALAEDGGGPPPPDLSARRWTQRADAWRALLSDAPDAGKPT